MSDSTTMRAGAGRAPVWTRALLVWTGVPQLAVGLWAVLAPRHWYDTFPGFGPLLVAAEPPFNAHLASDAGGGFVATGAVALVAAVWGTGPAVLLAGIGLAAFALPHLAFHALHPAEALGAAGNVGNVVVLALAAALPIAAAWGARPAARREALR